MNDYLDEVTISLYIVEYNAMESAISVLADRLETIDTILRNEHNFDISKDRL